MASRAGLALLIMAGAAGARERPNKFLSNHATYEPSPTAGVVLAKGAWWDFWLALGGSEAVHKSMDPLARAWLQVEMTARLRSARADVVDYAGPSSAGQAANSSFDDLRLKRFDRALNASRVQWVDLSPRERAARRPQLEARLQREVERGATGTRAAASEARSGSRLGCICTSSTRVKEGSPRACRFEAIIATPRRASSKGRRKRVLRTTQE